MTIELHVDFMHAIAVTLPQDRMLPNITVLSVASLLGQAIKRIHRNESVSMMFQ